uniref:hypothetical protein n=1 Tax=uncultured Tenacibaculum sp. TaxID=174713 RepID=UPI002623ECA6
PINTRVSQTVATGSNKSATTLLQFATKLLQKEFKKEAIQSPINTRVSQTVATGSNKSATTLLQFATKLLQK